MLSMHVLERSTLGSILLYHPIFVYSRQGMDNFNQPLSFDTSSVTDMFGMFQVRSPAGAQLELLHHPFVYSRQDAYKFNQPLSFDTSSVTSMTEMFKVRALPCTPSARPTPRKLSCALFATLGGRKLPVRRQQAAHPLRMGGNLGLHLRWLWLALRLLALGSGKLRVKEARLE